MHLVFHISQLRHYTPGGPSRQPPAPVEVDGETQYEIEAILCYWLKGKSHQYLIRWLGYGHSEDEWVHEEELGHASWLLEEYKSQHGLS